MASRRLIPRFPRYYGRSRRVLLTAFLGGEEETYDYTGSTLTASVFALTANGSATTTLTGTVYRNDALAAGETVNYAVSRTFVSAANSTVTATGTIENNGTDAAFCGVRVLDTDGTPLPGIPAASVVLAVSGTGNTVTQPTGSTNADGWIYGSFVSTVAATKTVSWTVCGLAITATSSVVVSGVAPQYPNEPAGYTQFVLTDYSALPAAPLPSDGNGYTSRSPSTNITAETGVTNPAGGTSAVDYHFISGTVAGFSPPSFAQFGMWDLTSQLSNTEYSAFYESTWFKLVGNGGTFEVPGLSGPGFKALGYFGVANNNQSNSTGYGPVQGLIFFDPVSTTNNNPNPPTASQFRLKVYTQSLGPEQRVMVPNVNTTKYAEVGTDHQFEMICTLNTPGSANGTLRWWLDNVLLGEYTDVEWISSSFAAAGISTGAADSANGLAGFFGRKYDLVWGGSGSYVKTRDDVMRYYGTYMSGVFLRAANP